MRMLFINLPASDLTATRTFYTALGFTIHEAFSDDQTLAVMLDDNIAAMLHTRDRFAALVTGEIADPQVATSAVNCLTADNRAEVDQWVAAALAGGGRPWLPIQSDDMRYTGSFTDPDGNVWQIMFMPPQHVID